MDLLTGYGSESDNEDKKHDNVPNAASVAQPSTAAPAAAALPPVALPNPFLGDVELASTPQQPARSTTKRPFTSVTGHSLATTASKPKANKHTGTAAPGAKPAAMLLPPQLKGRSNVVTEDLDKLFTKRSGSSNKP